MDKYIRDIDKGSLFTEELILIPEGEKPDLTGEYKNGVLWIVNHNQDPIFDPDHKKFANSILAQIPETNANLDTIGGINLHNKQVSFLSIVKWFKPKVVFCWGTDNYLKGIEKSMYFPQFLGDTKLIFCEDINSVKDSKEAKSKLWQAMKLIFNIT